MAEIYEWNEKLFGCFDDMLICCWGCWCPSCLFGYNASKLDGKNGIQMCCIHYCLAQSSLCWIPQYFQRQKLRQRYGLKEDKAHSDLPASFCHSSCALCQEAREMKSRGYLLGKTMIHVQQPQSAIITSQQQLSSQYEYESDSEGAMQLKLERL